MGPELPGMQTDSEDFTSACPGVDDHITVMSTASAQQTGMFIVDHITKRVYIK